MKKVTLILAALTLVLGITQCKKQEKPVQIGEKQHIVLTANNGNDGSKVAVESVATKLNLTWESTDKINVSGAVEGTLDLTGEPGSATAKFEGTVTRKTGDQVVFTVGSQPNYMEQAGTLAGLKDLIHLKGTSPYEEDGEYNVDMTLQYAVLKLDLSYFGTTEGTKVTITGENTVASVTGITAASKEVYVALLPATEPNYTFTSTEGKMVTKNWALAANTFYTLDNGTGSGSGDAIVIVPAFEFIDLGLPSGTLWANMNLGAKSIKDDPTCCGDYYAWSKKETYYELSSTPPVHIEWKANYSEGYNMVYGFPYTKYNDTDGLKRLELVDDVANAVLGDGAQIPSVAQWNELIQNCDKSKTNNEGYGYVTLTSRFNGNSIILPAGGFFSDKVNSNYGNFGVYYMTSELSTTTNISEICSVWCGANEELQCSTISRFSGVPVRAVKPGHAAVKIGGLYWATENLAITPSGKREFNNTGHINGDYFQWAAHEGYCGSETDADKGLLIYTSFTSKACGDATDAFSFKSSRGNFYRFSTSDSGSDIGIAPYHSSSSYTKYTSTDGKVNLERTPVNDDVANIILGGSWRMPTKEELKALCDNTKWTWDSTDKGYYVTAKDEALNEDKSNALLFFPATGFGYESGLNSVESAGRYLSNELNTGNRGNGYNLQFSESSNFNANASNGRYTGITIRPVHD